MNSSGRSTALQPSWRAETDRFAQEETDYALVDCAILPDELLLFELMADEDASFWDTAVEWHQFIWEREIWLPLEQSCYQGLLLPVETRMMRLVSCPEELLRGLRWFFELCPEHVKHHLAYYNYLLVRVERGRRTGCADWHPTEVPEDEETATALFKWGGRYRPRHYAR